MNLRIVTRNRAADPEIRFLIIDFRVLWPRNDQADSAGVNRVKKAL